MLKMKIIFCFLSVITITFVSKAQQSTIKLPSDSELSNRLVYVVGDVAKPAKISYQESISLLEAIHKAGGTLISEKKSRAIITRRLPDCKFETQIVISV